MALTKNVEIDHYLDQELRTYDLAAGAVVHKGALLGLKSDGYARPLTAGDPFIGIAYEEMDNTAGADGAATVRAYTVGDFGFTLSGATTASQGRPVFATADDTLSFTADGNSYVGIAQGVVAADEIVLRIDPNRRQIKTTTHAVENLSAGADIAARAVHVFQQQGWVVAARVVNQGTASAGIDDSNTCVVALATGAGTVATVTFNSTTTFPAANTAHAIGSLTNTNVAKGSVMTLAVTNGATADPGPFVVEVDYV
jgi:hypothetical protein